MSYNIVSKRFKEKGMTFYQVKTKTGNFVIIQGKKNLLSWLKENK